MHDKLERQATSSVQSGLYSGLISATIGVGGTSLSVLAIGAGAYLVIGGEISLGTLFAYTELLWYVAEGIQEAFIGDNPVGGGKVTTQVCERFGHGHFPRL